MLYLIHCLIINWPQYELVKYWCKEQGFVYNEACLWVFLIFTPVLILISWLLEMGVDTPSKNFANEVD